MIGVPGDFSPVIYLLLLKQEDHVLCLLKESNVIWLRGRNEGMQLMPTHPPHM